MKSLQVLCAVALLVLGASGCSSFNRFDQPAGHYGSGGFDFNYTITGTARWRPNTVFNDGVKTVIQMPHTMEQTEAPTLLVVRSEGGLFHKEELVLVNYRVQSNRYIVDLLFDKAVLLVGVGLGQDRVTITRGH